ncbi:hypothetical protein [Mycolicibacterium cosmeticum]|uniref:hypothetical protein n=1 Tax=Mycolicibacterium cosmeticum TaxID=258533 RepID=UPI0032047F00
MSGIKQFVSVVGGAAAFATAVGLTAGVATAAPAHTDGAMLYVCQDLGNPSSYRITVKGVYPMQQPDAAGYLIHMNDGNHPGGPGPGGLRVQLKADDTGDHSDQDIGYGFYPTTQTTSEGYLQAGPGGLEYRREMVVPRPNFNEDHKQPGSDDDVDEVYAVATFRDRDGGERRAVTQVITRNFEVAGVCDGCCN